MQDKSDSPWVDISVRLREGMPHWPGDAPFSIGRIRDMAQGDTVNLSSISMGAHSGTHVDAPVHFVEGGKGVDEMPLEALVGTARVIEIRDTESIKPAELEGHGIRSGERILFKTRNSSYVWHSEGFVEDFVFLSDGAARFLVGLGVRAVGVDYLSVGSSSGGREVHRILLAGSVWIMEGLDLSGVAPGRHFLVCLPLKVAGGDGAPARAILRPLQPG